MKAKYRIGQKVKRINYHGKDDRRIAEEFPEDFYKVNETFTIETIEESFDKEIIVYFGSKGNGCYESEVGLVSKLEKALQ